MPIVSAFYKMVVPSGHHRQPRNTGGVVTLATQSPTNVVPGNPAPVVYASLLPYGGGTGNAQLMFWSVVDGTSGQVFPAGPLNYIVQTNPVTITAWYFPISGPSSPGGPEIIDDAFSANLGDFIDDTFVDVTSDPSLTSDANVVGVVPTTEAETLVAHSSVVSTPEPFKEWIRSWNATPVSGTSLNVPKNTVGMAVAIYQSPPPPPSGGVPINIVAYNPWWWIETWWGHGPDSGPEGVRDFAVAMELAASASRATPKLRGELIDAALQQAKVGAALMKKQLRAQAR